MYIDPNTRYHAFRFMFVVILIITCAAISLPYVFMDVLGIENSFVTSILYMAAGSGITFLTALAFSDKILDD